MAYKPKKSLTNLLKNIRKKLAKYEQKFFLGNLN